MFVLGNGSSHTQHFNFVRLVVNNLDFGTLLEIIFYVLPTKSLVPGKTL